MAILVTGSTGTIGSQVLTHLHGRNVEVRALTRSPEKAQIPSGMTAVRGDLADVDSVRSALEGVSTLFLLAPNAADELTQAMLALEVAREAGVKGIVYLSVFKGEAYADVPHFAGKHTVERMIEALDLPATVLRPAYFIQNDLAPEGAAAELRRLWCADRFEGRLDGRYPRHRRGRGDRAGTPGTGPHAARPRDLRAGRSGPPDRRRPSPPSGARRLAAPSAMAATIWARWRSVLRPCCPPGTLWTYG